jgi:hypothetical protein
MVRLGQRLFDLAGDVPIGIRDGIRDHHMRDAIQTDQSRKIARRNYQAAALIRVVSQLVADLGARREIARDHQYRVACQQPARSVAEQTIGGIAVGRRCHETRFVMKVR